MTERILITISNHERTFPGGGALLSPVIEDVLFLGRVPCDMELKHIHFSLLNEKLEPIEADFSIYTENRHIYSGLSQDIVYNGQKGEKNEPLFIGAGERIKAVTKRKDIYAFTVIFVGERVD